MNKKLSDIQDRSIYLVGALSGVVMLAIILAQIVIYIVWPPPVTVRGFFDLFQQNPLLGLLSMDLLYILNNTLLVLIYLAIYKAMKPAAPFAALIALVLGLLGIAAYYASNTAFEMLSLSRDYIGAVDDAARAVYLSAGQAMLEIYKGTAFNTYYVLNAISLLVFTASMLRSPHFDRATAIIGLISAVLMSIPSTAGFLGLVFSFLSLIPWTVFVILIARRFLQLASQA